MTNHPANPMTLHRAYLDTLSVDNHHQIVNRWLFDLWYDRCISNHATTLANAIEASILEVLRQRIDEALYFPVLVPSSRVVEKCTPSKILDLTSS